MIRYPVTHTKLKGLIESHKPGWLARASERTESFKQLGRYKESSSIWSEVKAVYMTLQGESKCAYCKRKMESMELGAAEQDVEHFRPKGNVRTWNPPLELCNLGIPFTAPPRSNPSKGYFLLPYHILNYAASCKPCNSAIKGDRFPIAGTYNLDATTPTGLSSEKAYLLYPIESSTKTQRN